VTWSVTIAVEHVSHEADLRCGYRLGFAGIKSFALKDYRIDYSL